MATTVKKAAAVKKAPAPVPTLDDYKAQVRETAIRVASDQGWCRDGLNTELKALGLDPIEKGHKVDLNIGFRVTGGTSAQAKVLILKAVQSLPTSIEGVEIQIGAIRNYKATDLYPYED